MKPYRRIAFRTLTVIGLLILWVMSSFATYNACVFANTNTEYIKNQTQLALKAEDLKMVRYFAYKALNNVAQAKTNYKECGCEKAIKFIDIAKKNLRDATHAENIADAQPYLEAAKKSIIKSITVIKAFEAELEGVYDDNILVLNTKEVLKEQGGVLVPPGKKLEDSINESLSTFEKSLKMVVSHVDCTDAFSFISRIHEKTKRELKNETLTDAKIYYHHRIKDITYNALLQLDGCPID
ncbi:MAG: hypothetical protein HKP38_05250 [Croceitalea sp.]|nr:hypothetical protein [Croceitalea sp.]NNL08611.1 hypothetical protein [Croceitalea sp.]